MIVVEITGRAGAGKSTLARKLSKRLTDFGFNSVFLSFAAPLKKYLKDSLAITKLDFYSLAEPEFDEFICMLTNTLYKFLNQNEVYVDKNLVENLVNKHKQKLYNGYKEYFENKNYEKGFRIFARIIGTNIIRYLDKSFFIRQVVNIIRNLKQIDFVFVDDFRFPNEDLSQVFANNENIKVLKIRVKSKNFKELNHIFERFIDKLEVDLEVYRSSNKYKPYLDKIVNYLIYIYGE